MALQMPYTKNGVTHPESYWKFIFDAFDKSTGQGRIVFNCYHDASCRNESLAYIIDQKDYTTTSKMTDMQAYEHALATLEGQAPAEGEEDTRVSFFDGAESV